MGLGSEEDGKEDDSRDGDGGKGDLGEDGGREVVTDGVKERAESV
jgi:hypothetical protein